MVFLSIRTGYWLLLVTLPSTVMENASTLCSCMNSTTHTMIQLVVSMHYYTLTHMNANITGFSGKDGKWFRH